MPIRFSCPECSKEFETPDAMAGKKIKCRGLAAGFSVPPNVNCRLATLRRSVQPSRERFCEASPTGKGVTLK